MSIINKIKCDICNKETNDFYKEIGWIHFKGLNRISISGGRKIDNSGDLFRYIFCEEKEDNIHFCSIKCLLLYLYFTKGNFNQNRYMTLDDKVSSIQEEDRKQKIIEIIEKVDYIVEYLES